MKKPILQFNGTDIPYVVAGDIVFISIRPICKALGVDYHRQYKNLKNDQILNGVLSVQTMRDSESRMRKYVALPEKYIYGWLFSINSNVPALQEYKKKCYDVLHQHFRGELTHRNELLRKKAQTKSEMDAIKNELKMDSDKFQRLNKLQGEILRLGKEMKKSDEQIINKQYSLFN
ncbi:MAG: phage antirepressor N-terminal domain-containing protein [Bacteroidales bacterium]